MSCMFAPTLNIFSTINIIYYVLKRKTIGILLCLISLSCATLCNNPTTSDLKKEIKKIVSLSPSISRQIIDLQAEELLVGVTSFHPPLKKKITIIGTLIRPNIEVIYSLQPDIVFFSAEDKNVQRINSLKKLSVPLFQFKQNRNFKSISENYLMLAKVINRVTLAKKKINRYSEKIAKLKKNTIKKYKTLILLSLNPLITVGNSYIHTIIENAGGFNISGTLNRAYPIISKEFILTKKPEVIILVNIDKKLFINIFKKYMNLITQKNKIVKIKPHHISYYTPKDYVLAVSLIKNIFLTIDNIEKK